MLTECLSFTILSKDSSLRELMSLVREVNTKARKKGTYFDFSIVYPNNARGNYDIKDVGTTSSGQKFPDGSSSLESKKFQIGDILDIIIVLPPKEQRDTTG